MDSQTETIDALDGFIATQRRLLARQRADIEHLQRLRNDLRERECSALSDLDKQLDHDSFRLSSQTDLRLTLPQKFDWNVFDKADITTLSTFATQVRQKRTALSKIQQSPLSELQVFVKTAKIEILDPILEQVAKSTLALQLESEEEEEEDNEICALERRRFEERAKILELKKRKIRGGGVAGGGGGFSSLTTRNVVFVRDDLEDETAEVDVDSWADGDKQRQRRMKKVVKIKTDMSDVRKQRPPKVKANGKGSSYHDETMKKSVPTCAAEDEERPKKKAKLLSAPSPLVKKRFHSTTKPPASSDDDDGGGGGGEGEGEGEGGDEEEGEDGSNDAEELGLSTSCTAAAIPPSRKKPKSETYKQAWSVDEQNLLEQLLETIPDGEQYRWLKISRAMGGRRTPRQVASRVQKYFEKLKKFGVAVD